MKKIEFNGMLWVDGLEPKHYNWANENQQVSFPAKLTCDENLLEINRLGKNFVFTNDDIISIDPSFSNSKVGIRINHKVEKYSEVLIFTPSDEKSEDIINEIIATGFLRRDTSLIDSKIMDEVKRLHKKSIFNNIFSQANSYYLLILIFVVTIIFFIISYIFKLIKNN